MSGLHQIELNWIVVFQGEGTLKKLMEWLSYGGAEAVDYLLPFVFFCVSRPAGVRLYLLFHFSSGLLHSLKMLFHLPRPSWIDTRIKPLAAPHNYGMPSGHVLAASIVWLFAAKTLNRTWAMAVTAVLFVALSRVYLGAHFISDVVGAVAMAVALLWLFHRLEPKVISRLTSLSMRWQLGVAVWATAVLMALGFGVQLAIDGIFDPPAWAKASRGARELGGLFYSSGEFCGAACGLILANRWAHFELSPTWWKRVAAWIYSLVGMWLLQELIKMVPSQQEFRWAYDFARGAILNGWMVLGAPLILLKVGLLRTAALAESNPLCDRGLERLHPAKS